MSRASLRRQLVTGVALVQLLLMGAFVVHGALRQRADLEAAATRHVAQAAVLVADDLALALQAGDAVAVDRSARRLLADDIVAGVEIVRPDGRLVWSSGDTTGAATYPLRYDGREVGRLRLSVDRADMARALAAAVRDGLAFALGALLLGLLLSLALAHALTRRLYRLLEVADAIREGRHDLRAPPSRVHEVGRLVESFNGMLDAIAEREQALARANDALETRVEERTAELAESIANHRAILEQANDAFVMLDEEGRIVEWNRAARTTFGWTRSQAYGRLFSELILPEDEREAFDADLQGFIATGQTERIGRRIEMQARTRDGRDMPVEMSTRSRWRGNRRYFDAFLRDITERKQLEISLAMQALHDSLTGLPNRRLLLESLPRAIQRADRNGTALGVYFIDLDGFKQVNDTYGHEAGDDVLREFACRIRESVRAVDQVARLAGDEFVVVAEAFADPSPNAEVVAAKLLSVAEQPYTVGGQPRRMSSSVGFAIYLPRAGIDSQALLSRADQAMYASKRAGKGRATEWHAGLPPVSANAG
ncbi:hypothetical protein GCM10008101_17500 [Lysobacter xinjiangensis]|uniref:PAS domain S-box-containing protein/diguanylate cyclase (GGDEF) domain-containing protein n=1 Tax=Cognatilysobacter xinjiangensis TaxID=546892 RepID=A0ABQ3C1E4_9GAMM|nr:diguanylate cyclase [Lysobacter xinjiangensis]GGZ64374.1 hypothetical protein GCM10008101_17500 [Lysobacter xinjiangensis]